MADVIYNSAKTKLMNGNIDLDTDTIKVALVTSSYSPNQDGHVFFSDITNEVSGTGYTAGGKELTNKTVTQDNTNNRGVFDADNVQWAGSTITARGAVIYKSTGTAGTSPLIAYIDFTSNLSTTSSSLTIIWNASGIFVIS